MIRQNIPNAITLCNLFCGCMAVLYLSWDENGTAAYFLAGAFIADFLDGLVARWLRVSSSLGAQLDSLADMVSFGVAPGVMLYQLLSVALGFSAWSWLASFAFLVTLFSAVRLAKFNLDARQKTHFIGLATPASTIFCLGLLLSVKKDLSDWQSTFIIYPPILCAIIVGLSYLLVAELPMFAFKFDKHSTAFMRYVQLGFLVVALLLLLFFGVLGLSMSVFLYVCLNIFLHLTPKKIF